MLFKNVVIFGAGTMGHAIALLLARGGHTVTLTDVCAEALARAENDIRTLAETLHTHGSGDSAETVLARMRFTPDGFAATLSADLVVEAISEQVDSKRAFYTRLHQVLRPETAVASNTSVLDIYAHAPRGLHSRLIMTHFFVPAYLVPLVEISGHTDNAPGLAENVAECLRACGMKPILLKKFAPGFILNRIQRAINQEIFQLLENGVANAEAIDDALTYGLGMRLAVMRYLSRLDFTGLDLVLANYRQPPLGLVTDETPPEILERMVAAGWLGFKRGRGFYEYSGELPAHILRERDERLLAIRKSVDALNRSFPQTSLPSTRLTV